MSKAEDLRGRRFGKLTVIERAPNYISPSGRASTMWKCKCDCGTVLSIRSSHLKEGKSKSCGCNGGKLINIIGHKFGKLVVVEKINDKNQRVKYKCKCNCGNIVLVDSYNLRHGIANPCDCSQKKQNGVYNAAYKHGGSKTRLYSIWQGMLNRCRNPNVNRYDHYGGRGISVCNDWNDFVAFQNWALSNGYSAELSIDRIDVNGDYCPENCRWVDTQTQSNNKTTSRIIEFNGECHNVAEWSIITGINRGTIQSRLQRGWSVARALSNPHRGDN